MKKYKPTSDGRRGMTGIDYRSILSTTQNNPHKRLVKRVNATGGRNSAGRITSHCRGNGVKRMYREIDFSFNKKDIEAKIERIEYDPFRSGFIALVLYKDGERRYILASKELRVGDTFIVSENARPVVGNRLPLGKLSSGTFIYNIETKPLGGAKLVRGAGARAEVVAQDGVYTHVKLPSTEVRKIPSTAWATVGTVSNDEHNLVSLGKAGRARLMGLRPKTRGTARNPVDHPYGGGEQKSPRGHRRARTKQGRPTGKGQKTRSPKKYSNKFIVSRRKPGKLMTSSK